MASPISAPAAPGFDLLAELAKRPKLAPGAIPMRAFADWFEPSWRCEFPLSDATRASSWAEVPSVAERRKAAEEWIKRSKHLAQLVPMQPPQVAVLLAYDPNGALIDSRLNWPSLALWFDMFEYAKEHEYHISGWPARQSQFADLFEALLDSGADARALQALRPNAMEAVVRELSAPNYTGLAALDIRWRLCEKLFERGWDPNAWAPHNFPTAGASSAQAFVGACGSLQAAVRNGQMEPGELVAGWSSWLAMAAKAGFDPESRTMSGHSALGLALANRGSDAKAGDPDARVQALLASGVDPRSAAQHWLGAFDLDSERPSAVARLERLQIDPGAASPESEPERRAARPRI